MTWSDLEFAWEMAPNFGFVVRAGRGTVAVAYEMDGRTPEEFAAEVGESLANPDEFGPIGALVPFRGGWAWVKEADVHGPAFITWVDGDYEITIGGRDSDLELDALLQLALSMPRASGTG